MTGRALSVPGAFVPIDEVASWMTEISTRDTPESLLIDREQEAEDADDERDDALLQSLASDRLKECLAQIPTREALALMLHLGLLGYPRTEQDEIGEVLGGVSQQVVSYWIRRARVRLVYLATRPALDVASLSCALSPSRLAIVRDVFTTASFAEAARKRWTCPSELGGKAAHAWQRVRSNRIKREFFRSLANIERRPELADQAAAFRHLVANLGRLSLHDGKGRTRRGS